RHAQFAGQSVELAQLHRIEGGDDEQDDVSPVRPGLVELVFVDHEVLAQDRDVHGRAHGIEVLEAAGEAAGLGEHAHGSGTAGGVEAGECAGVGNMGQIAARGRLPLDLGDDGEVGVQVELARGGGRTGS